MYDYYNSLPGYISALANILLVIGIVALFINIKFGIAALIGTIVLWIVSALLHRKKSKEFIRELKR